MNKNNLDDYAKNVIGAGDEASGNFKAACQAANREHSLAHRYGILATDGENILLNQSHILPIIAVKETIDGVGTKVQIYQNQFEHSFKEWEAGNLSATVLRATCIDLWTRMLMDLIAMNADDLRNGELAISVTDIIDINFLVGPNDDKRRGNLLQDTLSAAFTEVIKTTGIALTAGETAVLGESPKTLRLYSLLERDAKKILEVLAEYVDTTSNERRRITIQNILNQQQQYVDSMKQEIHFNIGGTALGLHTNKSLISLKDDEYIIVALHEIPKNGIIGPRSNGITKIREDMTSILGEGWENKSFSDFVAVLGDEKAKKISDAMWEVCKDKKMWEIATGQTTVFNPFVANTVLGGLHAKPIARIAKLIHVTGNPLKKITEGVGNDFYRVDIDMSNTKIPHIVELLQIAKDMPDEMAMNKWNMGVPYALIIHPDDVDMLLSASHAHSINAQVVGKITKHRSDIIIPNTITGVGIGKSTITF